MPPAAKSYLSAPEIETLLHLLRSRATQVERNEGISGLQSAPLRWPRLVRSAIGGDLAGYFVEPFGRLGLEAKAQRRMAALALEAEAENRTYRAEAIELCAAARRAGLVLVPLKGAALLIRNTYPDLSCRKMCDLDLLTSRAQLDAMCEFLLKRNYRDCSDYHRMFRYSRSLLFRKEVNGHAIPLELHWSAFLEMAPSRGLDADVIGRLRPVEVDNERIDLLSDEDMLLGLAVHLGLHRYRIRLKWLLDLARFAEQAEQGFDWRLFWRNAKTLGAVRSTNYSLHLAKALLDAPVELEGRPSRVLEKYCPPFALLENRAHASWGERLVVDLLLRDSAWAGIRSWAHKAAELGERHSRLAAPAWLVRRDPRA